MCSPLLSTWLWSGTLPPSNFCLTSLWHSLRIATGKCFYLTPCSPVWLFPTDLQDSTASSQDQDVLAGSRCYCNTRNCISSLYSCLHFIFQVHSYCQNGCSTRIYTWAFLNDAQIIYRFVFMVILREFQDVPSGMQLNKVNCAVCLE